MRACIAAIPDATTAARSRPMHQAQSPSSREALPRRQETNVRSRRRQDIGVHERSSAHRSRYGTRAPARATRGRRAVAANSGNAQPIQAISLGAISQTRARNPFGRCCVRMTQRGDEQQRGLRGSVNCQPGAQGEPRDIRSARTHRQQSEQHGCHDRHAEQRRTRSIHAADRTQNAGAEHSMRTSFEHRAAPVDAIAEQRGATAERQHTQANGIV